MGRYAAGMPTKPDRVQLTVDGVEVEVRRSVRRRRSMSARLEQGRIIVLAPAHLSAAAERTSVEQLVRKLTSRRRTARSDDALMQRAEELTQRYIPGAPRPTSVRWVPAMTSRWASCTPTTGAIRVSETVREMPQYVVDGVLIHELAHLVESGHGPEFQRIVRAYPQHDLVEAYLAGASFGARQRPGALPADGLSALDDD